MYTTGYNTPSFAGRFDAPVFPAGYESSKLASILPSFAEKAACPSTYERMAALSGVAPSSYERFGGLNGYPMAAPSTFDALNFGNFAGYPSTYERVAAAERLAIAERIAACERMGLPVPAWAYSAVSGMQSTWAAANNWTNWTGAAESTYANLHNVAFRPTSAIELYCLTNPIRIMDREGNRMIWLCYELKGFKPEEVTVTLIKAERAILVEAVHEVKEGKEHHVSRKFSRKFVLPESLAKVDFSKVELKSCLTTEGYLTIECTLPKMTAEEIKLSPVMSKINETPFHFGAGYNAAAIRDAVNTVRPVTVKTA